VNVPLPPFTPDELWLDAFRQVVPPLLESWRPEVMVTQLGCDTHSTDPLTNMLLTTAAFRETAKMLHGIAHDTAGGKWLATGGGGYRWATVVPRAWTIYFAEMAEVSLPDEIPRHWIERVQSMTSENVPSTLSEPEVNSSLVTRDEIAWIVQKVKETIFPYHGL
jgi:acetoin utilization protein AcuC